MLLNSFAEFIHGLQEVNMEVYAECKEKTSPPVMKGLDREVGSDTGSDNPFDDDDHKSKSPTAPAVAAASSWSLFSKAEPVPKKLITSVVDGLKVSFYTPRMLELIGVNALRMLVYPVPVYP